MSSQEDRKKKEKKKKDWLEAQIMAILEKSLRAVLDEAMEDVMKSWKL